MLPYRELSVGKFCLLVVEKESGFYRLYVGLDGEHYCHYDLGSFKNLDEAANAAQRGFDPGPFLAFPYAPFRRAEVLMKAPHGFEAVR